MRPVSRYSAPVIPPLPKSPSLRPSVVRSLLLLSLLCFLPLLRLSAQDTPEALRQKVEQQYALTKPTASQDDIVTAGAVLVLEKDNLEMSSVGAPSPAQNIYGHGKITQSGMTAFKKATLKCPFGMCGDTSKMGKTRTFVAGEKFWLTKVEVRDDAVILSFFSDPISDTRYVSTLKVPYTKSGGAIPSDQVLAAIGEVIKVQPSDDAKSPALATAPNSVKPAGPPPPPAAPAMAAIPPPPPPPDAPPAEPKSVKLGQTRDIVIANFGQPSKVLDKGATKIYVYPDMKVTFGKTDKVIDVQ